MLKQLILVCSFIFLVACASSPPRVTIHSDEFSREIEVEGIAQYDNPFLHYNPHLWRLRTFINKDTHKIVYQAYLLTLYKGSRKNYKYADDDTATPLKITQIENGECAGNNVEKCEAIGMVLEEDQLKEHVHRGYRIRVKAKSGDILILTFTPEMIRQQLDAVQRLIGMPAP